MAKELDDPDGPKPAPIDNFKSKDVKIGANISFKVPAGQSGNIRRVNS